MLLIALALAVAGCDQNGSGEPPAETGDDDGNGNGGGTSTDSLYANPVLNRDFPDPTVIEAPDGWYYAYGTETMIDGVFYNIQVARSQDLVRWSWIGDAFPNGVSWATQGHSYWAPHVTYAPEQERYIMYFSAHHDVHGAKCLDTAVSDSPSGPFVADDEPLLCGQGFVEIDPMAFDDPVSGRRLLYWGAGGQPIKVQELADDCLSFKEGTEPQPVVFPREDDTYSNLLEGAWVIYRDPYYYMFYSGDNCCGDQANYAVMVARAEDPFGPFERLGAFNGTDRSTILVADHRWRAPGHNSVVQDDAGGDWIVYHAIDRAQPRRNIGIGGQQWDRRVMLMDRILYDDNGWPYIDGGQPSETAKIPIIDE